MYNVVIRHVQYELYGSDFSKILSIRDLEMASAN